MRPLKPRPVVCPFCKKTFSPEKELLTERELEVAIMAAQGSTNLSIGETLCISVKTVKNHIISIYRKLGVGTRYSLLKELIAMDYIDIQSLTKKSDKKGDENNE